MNFQTIIPQRQLINTIKKELNDSADLIVRELAKDDEQIWFVFIDTLIDEIKFKSYVLEPITQQDNKSLENAILSKTITVTESIHIMIDALLKGHCLMISDKTNNVLMLDIASTNSRPIQESTSEQVIKGAHDGFVENIILNIYQIRKRIENKNLTVEYKVKGKYTKSKIAVVYVSDLVNKKMLKEINRRLDAIDLDYLQNPGSVIECIEDSSFSPFPQILQTERPDRTAAALMDGKTVIVLDGSPIVLILPAGFFSFYQSPEDYNIRWYMSSMVRMLRILGFVITLVLPALYIALVGVHHELIPSELIFPLQASVSKVPFPPIIEAIIMLLTMELIREVAIRLPTQISVTIGLVGATLIGQAIVAASLLSNMIIVVIAFTAIASFAAPAIEMSNTTRIIGFPIMILGYLFGLLGVAFGLFIVVFHLCTLRSVGQPYLEPLAPMRINEYGDTLIRRPLWAMKRRETGVKPQKIVKEHNARKWEHDE